MATLNEALGLVDDIARELSFYDGGSYKQLQEQTGISRCKDLVEKVKTAIMARDSDGNIRADKLSSDQWRRISKLMGPLARCFTASTPAVAPTAKTRHGSAVAVATLALLSSCNQKSKVIATSALETGVVDAFVTTLRASLRNPVSDRVVKAMLYKLIEALWGFTLYASTQLQQDLVARDVVNICLDLVTAASVETESKLNASKTLYNCLSCSNGRVVTELRTSKVVALSNLLQQLASQVPDPQATAGLALTGGGGSSGAAKAAISMPVMLPAIMSWIWFLPGYILDHMLDALALTLRRVVMLVWPEGSPGLSLLDPQPNQGQGKASQDREAAAAAAAGPLHVAQLSLPNRTLQKTLQNLFRSIASGLADSRLVSILRGTRLTPAAASDDSDLLDVDEEEDEAEVIAGVRGTALPARLVRVVGEGRPDGMETKVALELLDELFACDANGEHPELGDDALAAGLLSSMTEMGVLHSLHTEAGLVGVSAYVRLTMKLIKRVPYTPGLAIRLHDSGVPASVAYVAFWPTSRVSLKLEALQTLYELVQLDTDMTEHVVAMNNFPFALTNTLLGGDPGSRKPTKKNGSKKRNGSAAAAAAAAAATATAAAAAADISGHNQANRNHRDQIQEAAFNILTIVLDEARESDKVWETVVESGMLPRLVQHSCTFPMQPSLLAELLLAIAMAFKDHREDTAAVGPLQAACAPHVLPLLVHQEPVVAAAAARVLRDILLDMARYRSDSTDVAEGDEILKALVAAGPAIDTAVAAATPAVPATAVVGVVVKDGEAGGGGGSSPGKMGQRPSQGVCGEGVSPQKQLPRAGLSQEAAAEESQRGSAQGDGMMEVDMPSTTTAAAAAATTSPDGGRAVVVAGSASGTGAGSSGAAEGGGDTAVGTVVDTATTTTAAAAAGTAAAAAKAPEVPKVVDVTAHGLGLICAAMQSCVVTVLQRQRPGTPVSSPSAKGGGGRARGGQAASAAAAATAPIVSEGPVVEALEALLLSCRVLCEACLQMPPHGTVRRHLARALAYARPAAEELAEALTPLPDPEPGHLQLLRHAREVAQVLWKVPVLDVVLLPKPKAMEVVGYTNRDVPAPTIKGAPKKGRPTGSGKRTSQLSLAAGGTLPPGNKRQRAASTAALPGLVPGADDAAAEPAPAPLAMGRTRSASLAAATNGDTGSPRISAQLTAGAAAVAVGPANGPMAVKVESRDGGTWPQSPGGTRRRRGAAGLPDGATGSRRGRSRSMGKRRRTAMVARAGGATGADTVLAQSQSSSKGPGAASGPQEVAAIQEITGAREGVVAGLELPLPAMEAAPPEDACMGAVEGQEPAAPGLGAWSESANLVLEDQSGFYLGPASGSAAVTAVATAYIKVGQVMAAVAAGQVNATDGDGGGTDGGGGGGGGGAAAAAAAAKGRINTAEFRARYLDMKAQNARMKEELEELRRAKEDSEALQQRTGASLSSRTEELARVLQELEDKDQELEAVKQELATVMVELQGAQERVNSLQAAVAGAAEQLQELQQLKAENADLKAELASLEDLE